VAPLNVERRGLIGRQVGLNMAPWACRAMDTSSIFFTSRARTTLKGALQCMMRLIARIEVYVPERDSGTRAISWFSHVSPRICDTLFHIIRNRTEKRDARIQIKARRATHVKSIASVRGHAVFGLCGIFSQFFWAT